MRKTKATFFAIVGLAVAIVILGLTVQALPSFSTEALGLFRWEQADRPKLAVGTEGIGESMIGCALCVCFLPVVAIMIYALVEDWLYGRAHPDAHLHDDM